MGLNKKTGRRIRSRLPRPPSSQLQVEQLEGRFPPALIGSQVPLVAPLLTTTQVSQLLQRAAAATSNNSAIVAIVDRAGNILGVRVESGVSPAITGNSPTLDFAIDGAIAEARSAAFFSSDGAPLTSRTVQYISQTTNIQPEVNSNPNDFNPSSTTSGPGLVAPIEIGGHFPPDINNTPLVDLFGIELTNRDGSFTIDPSDGDKVPYGIDPAFVPNGVQIPVTGISYAEAIGDPNVTNPQSRGIGTLPGGIPIYEYGELIGGIGVFFPGTTGYASEENSSLSADFNPAKPDLAQEAEFIALAAVGGSSGAGFPVGTLGGVAALPGFDLPNDRIDLAGITLATVGTGGSEGPANLVQFALANYGVGQGDPNSTAFPTGLPVDTMGNRFLNGTAVPTGWLVLPHAGTTLSAAQVNQIIQQGIVTAEKTRSQLRLPIGDTSRMILTVTDGETGEILGLYRMPDAPVFSIDVAIAKARNVAYYDNPAQLQPQDQVPGLPKGVSMTNRTFRYLADPRFPEGVDNSTPGPFSILTSNPASIGINPSTGLNTGAQLPASAYEGTVFGFAAYNPGTNFHATAAGISLTQQNGVVFFPGSSAVYVTIGGTPQIVGGWGVSGDGVNQDDFITVGGIAGFAAPSSLAADQYFVRGVRLPYFKFPPNPEN
jgi:uncharacterized protein GlcG (DUF336 family)